jgi:hypothetical protein
MRQCLPPTPSTPATLVDAPTHAPTIAPSYAISPTHAPQIAPTTAPPPRMVFEHYYCVDFEVPGCDCAFYDDSGHLTCH